MSNPISQRIRLDFATSNQRPLRISCLWVSLLLTTSAPAAQDLPHFREDFNGDGKPDIACIGASTGNVKLYLNSP